MADEMDGDGLDRDSLVTPPSTDNRPSVQQDERVNYHPYRPSPSQPHRCTRLPCLFLVSVAAAVIGSSTQFGYSTGVLNSPQQVIRQSFEDRNITFSSLEMNVAVSIFAIGGLLGAVSAGILADFLGRKYTLLVNNLLVLIGAGLQSLAVHPGMFIAGRFVVGINSGINTVLVPLYISEISPVRLRGAVGVLHQMAITVSLLLAQILGISKALGRSDSDVFYGWRLLFAVPLLFSLVQLALLPWSPRSPRFLLIKRKNEAAAKRALKRLRGAGANTDEEIQEMQVHMISHDVM
ncbi:Solute carrier family 2, facilitated glucose transporter member 1 [Geodia barretti]|uniref:Solute carrier family 2, facilitated glucose transporter member 1 n=1 Tax=Geodia barretti TaxID=519541 RepID=A0AA35R3P5_GEOBA|nr:Solute carrier family 2, facilitated glucose transporter member 1 [Geodia barretti]